MVTNKLREYALDLFRLADKAMETDARIRFVRSSGTAVACRVYIAEGKQPLVSDENMYSLYVDPDKWAETQHNYQLCKARLVRLVVENKNALT